ncbi:ThiF family adenylyltransferase [Tepidibacillus fermentans]|uniref:Adenylyltransferase/sulfurtransferase n=1 Tax=Tepidibacillus fermentans TaxID=1281767 RepID=A0A4R3KLB7_9BACI|nr:ThiF family adenylyltransferase [Tepidibacillus fermentans]TCS84537.1 adenylyltransferase/sulfurtransferase [Tepidibacillus fermentans]
MDQSELRYSRQHLFPFIGKKGQEKLKNSRIAIVGMGALGTALANHMVRSGVGYVRIMDRDFVEYSNLQRQMLYDEKDAKQGLPKAIAAKEKLNAINSDVIVDAHVTDLTWKNAEKLLSDVDLILDGTDNFDVRYLVNDVAVKYGIPWIYGGAVSSRGMTFTIIPEKTPCFRCLFPEAPAPGTTQTCDTAGVIGPIIQVVAAYQATEALKLLVGDDEHLSTSLRNFELWQNDYSEINVKNARNEDCPTCGHHHYDYLDPNDKSERVVSLCGRDTIQITPGLETKLDLKKLAKTLQLVGRVEETPFLLRFYVESYKLTIFPDGRTLVQGTDDLIVAKNLFAKYIGG